MTALSTRRRALVSGLGLAAGAAGLLAAGHAVATPVPFDAAWEHLIFRRLMPNQFALPAEAAAKIRPDTSIRRMMLHAAAQVLMYTWGGGQPLGTIVPSTHAPQRLRNLITRPAQPGQFFEEVDLTQDFPRVFGQDLQQLVAVAISANSENSGSRLVARVSDLRVL